MIEHHHSRCSGHFLEQRYGLGIVPRADGLFVIEIPDTRRRGQEPETFTLQRQGRCHRPHIPDLDRVLTIDGGGTRHARRRLEFERARFTGRRFEITKSRLNAR
jgi:hypothetical protein